MSKLLEIITYPIKNTIKINILTYLCWIIAFISQIFITGIIMWCLQYCFVNLSYVFQCIIHFALLIIINIIKIQCNFIEEFSNFLKTSKKINDFTENITISICSGSVLTEFRKWWNTPSNIEPIYSIFAALLAVYLINLNNIIFAMMRGIIINIIAHIIIEKINIKTRKIDPEVAEFEFIKCDFDNNEIIDDNEIINDFKIIDDDEIIDDINEIEEKVNEIMKFYPKDDVKLEIINDFKIIDDDKCVKEKVNDIMKYLK